MRPVGIVVGSVLFGMATRAARPLMHIGLTHYESLIAVIVLAGVVLALAIFHRRKGYQLAFQLENLALWSGWTSGWSLIHGGVWSDLLSISIPFWLGCAVLGGVVVSLGRTRGADAQPQ